MQLNRHTDYTLRVLLYMAARPDERSTLAQVAAFFDISIEHLRKVVHALAKSGYLNTFQGKGGGIELARPLEDINIGEVVVLFEGGKPLIDCHGLACPLAPACTLSLALAHAQRAFFQTLSGYTLADLVSDKSMMRQLVVEAVPARPAT